MSSWITGFGSRIKSIAKGAAKIFLVGVGAISDGAQTIFTLNEFWKLFYNSSTVLKGLTSLSGFGGAVRMVQSCFLEYQYVGEGVNGLIQTSKDLVKDPKQSLKNFFHPRHFLPWLLGMAVNLPGATTAALGTIVGFLTVLPAEVFILILVVASVDALQTMFTEGAFLRELLIKIFRNTTPECAARCPELEDKEAYLTQSVKSKLIWFFVFIVPGLLGGAIEAGVASLVWINFLQYFNIERTLAWEAARYYSMTARGLQNIALDGACMSDFFAKLSDKPEASRNYRISKVRKAFAIMVGVLGVAVSGAVGYVGMQQIASSFLADASLVTVSCLAAILRATQSIVVETNNLYQKLSEPEAESEALLQKKITCEV
ncbi:MAG: hypothetical protein K0S08_1166 [Gammaproteobacteria bacterium]|jgi:hypothetical protein|nr:hypothetical protein [Gammaproteobacteria bacterium]